MANQGWKWTRVIHSNEGVYLDILDWALPELLGDTKVDAMAAYHGR
jgi:hypothetical protein